MRLHTKIAVPAGLVLLAALVGGCLQGVKLVTIDLGTHAVVNGQPTFGRYVDLASENSTYRDNKDKFKAIEDVAVLGTFQNHNPAAVSADIYLVSAPANSTILADRAAVVAAGGVMLWSLSLGPSETQTLTWDNSAALFAPGGKTAIKDELSADGVFTLYVFGSTGTYNLSVTNSAVAAMIGVTAP